MERRQRRAAANAEASSDRPAKSFLCSHVGCGKRFTRLEHQRRHEYNHGVGDATCPRCSAHFKRPDLLERHLNRHRQKDEEAGGEGNGVLNTRKRSWKAPDGTVVAKRPAADQQSSDNQAAHQGHQDGVSLNQEQNTELPISPPASTGNADTSHYQDFHVEQHDDSNFLWASVSGVGSGPNLQENLFIDPGLIPPGISSSSQQYGLPFDDVFQPDTASSFNMPYTTAANYNFLFGPLMDVDPAFSAHTSHQTFSSLDVGINQPYQEGLSLPATMVDTGDNQEASYIPTPSSNASVSIQGSDKVMTDCHENISANHIPRMKPATPAQDFFTPSDSPVLERPLSTLDQSSKLPLIQDDVRDRILEIVDIAQPAVPGGNFNAWDHPGLTLDALQEYLDFYFTQFNTTYPLIHRATFDANQTEPLLLLNMILLGATYSNPQAHQLAVCIHDPIRPQIFSHAGFTAKPELWVLKTILLVECMGKSRAGKTQHEMSHLFHGLLINLIRRSDCQTAQTMPLKQQMPAEGKDLQAHWRKWVEAEEKKRLALLCFMWDTQHAVLFCQSLCMSAFELRLTMPCNQAIWEAKDEKAWRALQLADPQPEITYLNAVKRYLCNPGIQRALNLNAFSRVLVLHGLMSISWDLERRDQTALGVVSVVGGVSWRNKLEVAYDGWKVDFDAFTADFELKLRQQSPASSEDAMAMRREFATFTTAYNSVYHAAQILLKSSFLDVQIYAGSRHILGRPVNRFDYVRSEKVVKQWASGAQAGPGEPPLSSTTPTSPHRDPAASSSSTHAAAAAIHAASMLSDASANLDDFDSMGIFHLPWCLYLATLTLWAYNHARPSGGGRWGGGAEDEGSEMVWDAKKDMEDLLSSMRAAKPWDLGQNQARRSTGGLTWIMAEALSKTRWGIVHAGVQVLKALIPMRLIGQYEAS